MAKMRKSVGSLFTPSGYKFLALGRVRFFQKSRRVVVIRFVYILIPTFGSNAFNASGAIHLLMSFRGMTRRHTAKAE